MTGLFSPVVSVDPQRFIRAGHSVADLLERAAVPGEALAPAVGRSPVDAAATRLSEAMSVRITAAAAEVAPHGPSIRAASVVAAESLVAEDQTNATLVRGVGFKAAPADTQSPTGDTASPAGAAPSPDKNKLAAKFDPRKSLGPRTTKSEPGAPTWKRGAAIGTRTSPITANGEILKDEEGKPQQWGTSMDPHVALPPITGSCELPRGKLDGTVNFPTTYDQTYAQHTTDGFGAKAGIGGSLLVAEGEYATKGGLLTGTGRIALGEGKLGMQGAVTDHGAYAGADAELIAARAKANATLNLGSIRPGLGASVDYGLGAHAHAGMGFQDGKVSFGADIGASAGLGGSIAPRISVDQEEFFHGAEQAAKWLGGLLN